MQGHTVQIGTLNNIQSRLRQGLCKATIAHKG